MQYFYEPSITSSEKHFILNAEESNHAVKVLRHKNGDELNLLNGKGAKATARIISANPKGCEMEVLHIEETKPPSPEIHIALALLKNRERTEWFVEKAVEIGASKISFFSSHYAEKKGFNADRVTKIAISALKQSGNLWLPDIMPPLSLEQLLQEPNDCMKFIAYCPVNEIHHLKKAYAPAKNALVLIGPEGDFTEEEVTLAKKNGFIEVSLGKNRLRAETAALVSLLALRLANE